MTGSEATPSETPTFMFTQEVNALLQYCGFVHLPGVAWQHSAKLFDEDIELVSPFLLRFVTGHAAIQHSKRLTANSSRPTVLQRYNIEHVKHTTLGLHKLSQNKIISLLRYQNGQHSSWAAIKYISCNILSHVS